jgi:hypothetical protein
MNTEETNNMPNKTLSSIFTLETARAKRYALEHAMPPAIDAGESEIYEDEDYRIDCADIPVKYLIAINFNEIIPDEFMHYWGNNTKCCVVVLPFNNAGNGKSVLDRKSWDSFVSDAGFLRLLSIMPTTKLTSGYPDFGSSTGRFFELLPSSVSKDVNEGGCTFNVRYPDPAHFYNPENRKWFIKQCVLAYDNLKRILAVPHNIDQESSDDGMPLKRPLPN